MGEVVREVVGEAVGEVVRGAIHERGAGSVDACVLDDDRARGAAVRGGEAWC